MRNKEQVEAELDSAIFKYLYENIGDFEADEDLREVYQFVVSLQPVRVEARILDHFHDAVVARVNASLDSFGNPEEVLSQEEIRGAIVSGIDSYMTRLALFSIITHLEGQGDAKFFGFHAPDCNCEDKDEEDGQH